MVGAGGGVHPSSLDMPRRAHVALAHIPTAHGTVVVRKAFAAKQRIFFAILNRSKIP